MNKQTAGFDAWFHSSLGSMLFADQRQMVAHQLVDVFGVHQLDMLISHRLPLFENNNVTHQVACMPYWSSEADTSTLVAKPEELAIASDTIDVVVLHHTLDMAEAPHQALREAARVLRSGGTIVIIGFNPFGLWGLSRWLRGRSNPPWDKRFIATVRVEDWLALLDFRITEVKYRFSHLPIQRSSSKMDVLQSYRSLPPFFSAYYCLTAKKQSIAMNPLRRKWMRKKIAAIPATGVLGRDVPIRKAPVPKVAVAKTPVGNASIIRRNNNK